MNQIDAPSADPSDLPPALERYFERSRIALALSEMNEDVPLCLVNHAFLDLTGYETQDVLGRNCRFLQGDDSDAADKAELSKFIHDDLRDSGRFHILNYRKDGSRFHNLVFMSRLRDEEGVTRYILASQFDMSPVLDRARLDANDATLARNISDIDKIAKEYGLAMISSAQLIADSITLIARLSVPRT
ncbi:PAS domain-containing protein [Thioclava sp. GXIMD4216]|uniref:PAS domain-containing protein n=1 Tax=Thioclava sp. GXIMD4216 TaxID=3131929 RepID=UPI0030CD9B3B